MLLIQKLTMLFKAIFWVLHKSIMGRGGQGPPPVINSFILLNKPYRYSPRYSDMLGLSIYLSDIRKKIFWVKSEFVFHPSEIPKKFFMEIWVNYLALSVGYPYLLGFVAPVFALLIWSMFSIKRQKYSISCVCVNSLWLIIYFLIGVWVHS
jgi:hypothetical protein